MVLERVRLLGCSCFHQWFANALWLGCVVCLRKTGRPCQMTAFGHRNYSGNVARYNARAKLLTDLSPKLEKHAHQRASLLEQKYDTVLSESSTGINNNMRNRFISVDQRASLLEQKYDTVLSESSTGINNNMRNRFISVDAVSERQTLNKNCGGALWLGAARHGAGARVLCLTARALGAGRSARTQRRRKSPAAAWISLPGGTPSGRRDPR
jgi:hypothetical protein